MNVSSHPGNALDAKSLLCVVATASCQQAGVAVELLASLRSTPLAFKTPLLSLSLMFQGKHVEAELLYRRCQAMQEKVLGPDHPDLSTTLNNGAALSESQVRDSWIRRAYRPGFSMTPLLSLC